MKLIYRGFPCKAWTKRRKAIGGFFVVLTEDGVVYYISENVKFYLGYPQVNIRSVSVIFDAMQEDYQVTSAHFITRGLKFLELGEKDLAGRSSYCFFHPDDLGGMALAHERLLRDSKVCTTFRVLKGSGKWQWVRGRAYSIINHGKVEGMVSKNLFLR
ncbi:hypothetical protein QZH41_010987 [Actinostola sp. cb2023]|nr:hypothetical protein QZH41_010987 [Actinostola sp. cb2023]